MKDGTGGAGLGYEASEKISQRNSISGPMAILFLMMQMLVVLETLHLFNPSSTTYVKNFYSTLNMYGNTSYTSEKFAAGYLNIASALTQIQFKMSGGNLNGTIMMYGVL